MKTTKKIFSNVPLFDQNDLNEAIFSINDLVDLAISNITDTKGLGPGSIRDCPELVTSFVNAVVIERNARHLIQTLQEGIAAIVDELRKIREKSA